MRWIDTLVARSRFRRMRCIDGSDRVAGLDQSAFVE